MVEPEYEFEDDTLPDLSPEEVERQTRDAILACKEADEHPELLLTLDQVMAFIKDRRDKPVQDAA